MYVNVHTSTACIKRCTLPAHLSAAEPSGGRHLADVLLPLAEAGLAGVACCVPQLLSQLLCVREGWQPGGALSEWKLSWETALGS